MLISDGYMLVVAVGFLICGSGVLHKNTCTHTYTPSPHLKLPYIHTQSNPNIYSEMQGFKKTQQTKQKAIFFYMLTRKLGF